MLICIAGANGFIGRNLYNSFLQQGYRIERITRKDFLNDSVLMAKVNRASVIINLVGAPILKRWTNSNKRIIEESRIETTKGLVRAINSAESKPELFISVSAVGIYSVEGEHTEESQAYANDFLGQLCQKWEKELEEVDNRLRVVIFRLGIVLGKGGGALKQMLPVFKLGLGATIGSSRQPMPWIHLNDVINAITLAMENKHFSGVINLVSPHQINNLQFSKSLARALKRPLFFRIPEGLLKLFYGKAAHVLTQGQVVIPKRLQELKFKFAFSQIDEALKNILRK